MRNQGHNERIIVLQVTLFLDDWVSVSVVLGRLSESLRYLLAIGNGLGLISVHFPPCIAFSFAGSGHGPGFAILCPHCASVVSPKSR